MTVSVRYLPDNRNPLWRNAGRWLVTAGQAALISAAAVVILAVIVSAGLLHLIRQIGRPRP